MPYIVKYAQYGINLCFEGTHFYSETRGYMELKGPVSIAFVRSLIPYAVWMVHEGTQAQGLRYCRSGVEAYPDIFEVGTFTPSVRILKSTKSKRISPY